MNTMKTLLKLTAAAAAVAGIAYLVVKNIDAITDWLKNLCPCKSAPEAEEVDAQETAEETVQEAPTEEVPAQEETAEEATPIPEGEPVADESDFES